jgi:hypothetical protein
MLERLQRGIFNRRARVAMRLDATVEELVEILNSSDENDKYSIGAELRLIITTPEVWETTKMTLEAMQP